MELGAISNLIAGLGQHKAYDPKLTVTEARQLLSQLVTEKEAKEAKRRK